MEYLDIVDDFGNPTGEIIERNIAHEKGIQHRTSHVWLIRFSDELEILLQKRSMNKDSFPGCYDISSAGHIPAGCSFEESAIRELEEELGIYTDSSKLVECGIRKFEFEKVFHGKSFHDKQISKVFYLEWDSDDFNIQESELEDVIWMPFNECVSKVRSNSIPHCIFMGELEMVFNKYNENLLKK